MAQRVIVTGAAGGIGRGISEMFVANGASVLMLDRDEAAVTKAAQEIGGGAQAHVCDVSVAADVEKAVQTAVDAWGGLDAVVNNAGVDHVGALIDTEEHDLDRMLSVNLKGVFFGIKYGARAIAASGGGAIVNIASIAGMKGAVPLHAAYSASKAGVISLTQTAAIELRDVKVRANAVCPGMILTPLMEKEGPKMDALVGMPFFDLVKQMQGRMGDPKDIAALVTFLASPAASLISGTVTAVDGAISAKAF